MTFETTIAVLSSTLVGAGALFYGLYQRNKLRRCEAWPQVMGTIRKAEIVRDTGPDSSGFLVSVLYDYSVNGEPHQGDKVGFRHRSYVRKKSAEAVVARYPPNRSVPVFYDPEKPADAVLVREYPDSILLIVIGIGLLVLVVVILLAQK